MAHATARKIGIAGYVRILAVMPATVQQIAEECNLCESSVRLLVRELRTLSIVYAKGSEPGALRGQPRPIWHFGLGIEGDPTRGVTTASRPQIIAFATVLRQMQNPSGVNEIHRETGVSNASVRSIISKLRDARLSHIADWEQRHGTPIAQHCLGARKNSGRRDAERPKIKTRQEINATQNPRQAVKRWMRKMLAATSGTVQPTL